MATGLSFRLFRIPFRAQVWFFVTLLLLNLRTLDGIRFDAVFYGLMFFLGIAIAGITVIVHELGHCFAYRRYGQEPSVMLWGLGGMTFGQGHLPPKRAILVALAGSGFSLVAQALPAFVLMGVLRPLGLSGSLGAIPLEVAETFFLYSVVWTVFNVLPINPLDGSHIAAALLEWRRVPDRRQVNRLVSTVTGAVAGVIGFWWGGAYLLLLFWVLALFNFLPWWQERNNSPVRYNFLPDHDDAGPVGDANVVSMAKARKKRDRRSPAELVKAGYEALEHREYKAALRITDRLQSRRLNAELDRWTAELAAFAWIGERNPERAAEAIGRIDRARMSKPLAAVLCIATRRTDDGLRLMVDSMVNEPEGGPKLIAVDLFAEYGMIHRLARDLVDQPGGTGFEAAVALEGMLHRLHRTQDASTVSDVILLG